MGSHQHYQSGGAGFTVHHYAGKVIFKFRKFFEQLLSIVSCLAQMRFPYFFIIDGICFRTFTSNIWLFWYWAWFYLVFDKVLFSRYLIQQMDSVKETEMCSSLISSYSCSPQQSLFILHKFRNILLICYSEMIFCSWKIEHLLNFMI